MDVNLLPDVAKFQSDKIKFSRMVKDIIVIIGVLWVSILVAVMGFYWINRVSFSNMDSKYKTLLADYLSMSEGVIINQNLRYKSKLVGQVLDKRFEYGKTFRQMESLFGDEVAVTKIELRDKDKFTFSGKVSSGELMDMVEKKVVDINDGQIDGFFGASINSVENEGDWWEFSLEVKL